MTVIRDDIKDPMLRAGTGHSLKNKVFSVSSAFNPRLKKPIEPVNGYILRTQFLTLTRT